jgi:putative acetyltransferase
VLPSIVRPTVSDRRTLPPMELVIAVEPPAAPDVADLLGQHLTFARATSPACHVHALDLDGLRDPAITFLTARRDGELVGVGALKELTAQHGELKSMHTQSTGRGRGVGRALLSRLLEIAAARGYERVSLETGTQDEFAPARALYTSVGFTVCEPFGEYTANPHSVCMTLGLPSPRNLPRS